MLKRTKHLAEIRELLRHYPAVGVLGPRQVGKTTIARALVRIDWPGASFFDLENARDVARLADPLLALESLKGLTVLDEIQRRPELFPALRVLADRPRKRSRFLILGSASPELLRQASESLAGRIAYHELGGFSTSEVGLEATERLWLRGGFPRSFLAASSNRSVRWRDEFVRAFVERDLPQLGVAIPSGAIRRFWTMLAHYHGQVWNAAEFGRALGSSESTARRYLDLLTSTFAVRLLLPWFENISKRQVKAPKVYVADAGILHTLLGIESMSQLRGHPKVGASWEGFVIGEIAARLGARPQECYFWRTHTGAELDLLVVRGRKRIGFEIKLTDAPRVTPSMRIALADLGLARLDVVHGGDQTFPLTSRIRALAFDRVDRDLPPL